MSKRGKDGLTVDGRKVLSLLESSKFQNALAVVETAGNLKHLDYQLKNLVALGCVGRIDGRYVLTPTPPPLVTTEVSEVGGGCDAGKEI